MTYTVLLQRKNPTKQKLYTHCIILHKKDFTDCAILKSIKKTRTKVQLSVFYLKLQLAEIYGLALVLYIIQVCVLSYLIQVLLGILYKYSELSYTSTESCPIQIL